MHLSRSDFSKANPTLTVTNSGPVTVGTQLQFNSTALNGNAPAAVSDFLPGIRIIFMTLSICCRT